MGLPVWTENDHYLHEKVQHMTTIARLQLIADWAGLTADYYRLDPGERRDRLIEIRHAKDRRVIGWVEDCPEPPYAGPRKG